jgi:hypothetical protein
VFVAGADFNAEAEAQVGDEVAMVNVAGATWFLRVVADLGALLVAVEGLDGDVDVEDPRQAEGGGNAAEDLAGDPVETGFFIDTADAEPHGIFTDSAFHAQQSGVDTVAANGVDVGVAPVAAKNAEQGGAHDVACAAATVAGVVERAIPQKFHPSSTGVEELEKEDELALAGDGGLVVPLGVKAPAGRVYRPAAGGIFRGCFILTRRVRTN